MVLAGLQSESRGEQDELGSGAAEGEEEFGEADVVANCQAEAQVGRGAGYDLVP